VNIPFSFKVVVMAQVEAERQLCKENTQPLREGSCPAAIQQQRQYVNAVFTMLLASYIQPFLGLVLRITARAILFCVEIYSNICSRIWCCVDLVSFYMGHIFKSSRRLSL
jgi:hypothetical protein